MLGASSSVTMAPRNQPMLIVVLGEICVALLSQTMDVKECHRTDLSPLEVVLHLKQ